MVHDADDDDDDDDDDDEHTNIFVLQQRRRVDQDGRRGKKSLERSSAPPRPSRTVGPTDTDCHPSSRTCHVDEDDDDDDGVKTTSRT